MQQIDRPRLAFASILYLRRYLPLHRSGAITKQKCFQNPTQPPTLTLRQQSQVLSTLEIAQHQHSMIAYDKTICNGKDRNHTPNDIHLRRKDTQSQNDWHYSKTPAVLSYGSIHCTHANPTERFRYVSFTHMYVLYRCKKYRVW